MKIHYILFLQIIFALGLIVNCRSVPFKYTDNIIHTEKDSDFRYFDLPKTANCLSFSIRAPKEFHLTLSKLQSYSDFALEYYLATEGNQKSYFKKLSEGADPYTGTSILTPNIMSDKYFHSFWLKWDDGEFKFGTKGDTKPIMQWNEYDPYEINYFGIRSGDSEAEFIIEEPNCP